MPSSRASKLGTLILFNQKNLTIKPLLQSIESDNKSELSKGKQKKKYRMVNIVERRKVGSKINSRKKRKMGHKRKENRSDKDMAHWPQEGRYSFLRDGSREIERKRFLWYRNRTSPRRHKGELGHHRERPTNTPTNQRTRPEIEVRWCAYEQRFNHNFIPRSPLVYVTHI